MNLNYDSFKYIIDQLRKAWIEIEELRTLNSQALEWRKVALRLGEELATAGPDAYYTMTPQEWFDWSIEQVRKQGEHRDRIFDALVGMVKEHCETGEPGIYGYTGVDANDDAYAVLDSAGMLFWVAKGHYRIREN